jgi:N6-L-threonylcarbamoyladenine synthase
MSNKPNIILGIESSCDDTSAAIIKEGVLLSNITAGQAIHQKYGGVVPELASRAHQSNIIPVIDAAIKEANINKKDISAVAFTQGPGLLGSLLVGVSFAKGFALANNIPLISVNHMQGHILAHFIRKPNEQKDFPKFPFLCLTVSGGHTQIVRINNYFDMQIIGETIDDAAGEAFDKIAKIMGLPYPGGPLIDKLAKQGNPLAFNFPKPKTTAFDFSFSGLKTSVLYFLRKEVAKNPHFIEENKADIAASVQHTIIEILTEKIVDAAQKFNISQIAIAGGVSANSGLRSKLQQIAQEKQFKLFIPPFEYCTDNAAMIAMAGYFKFLNKQFSTQKVTPNARLKFGHKQK